MMNQVLLTGRITKDPELRYTQSGVASCNFTIAVDRQFRDANGNKQSDFINCVAWRQQADFMSKYVKKGNMLAVVGTLQVRTYQDQSNQTRYVTEVVLTSVENMQPKAQEQPQQPNYQGYNNPQYQAPQQPQQKPQQQAQYQLPQDFNVEVSDDDLPF